MGEEISRYAAFAHLPEWIEIALTRLFRWHLEGRALTDEELRWELGIRPGQLYLLRHTLRLVPDHQARPSALGLLQLPEAAGLVGHLARLARLVHERYRPGAKPIDAAELPALLGIGADETQKLLPFAHDLDLVEGPPWRVVPTEDRASRVTLGDAIHSRYRDRFERERLERPFLRQEAVPVLPIRLQRLHAERYRVLSSFDLELGAGPTVLVGPNGAGKSTVLDMIAFVAQALEDGTGAALADQGGLGRLRTRGSDGPVALELGFTCDLAGEWRPGRYSFQLEGLGPQVVVDREQLELQRDVLLDGHRSVARLRRPDGRIDERFHAADTLALHEVDDERTYPLARQLRVSLASLVLLDRDPLIAEDRGWGLWGTRTGRPRRLLPLRQLLGEIARDDAAFARLSEVVGTLVPGIERIERVIESGDRSDDITVSVEAVEEGIPGTTALADMSAGARQMLALAALHATPRPPQIILLEEPDAGLHVGALPALRDLLASLAQRSTVVATTHSPAFVGLLDAEKEVVALGREPGGTLSVSSLAAALRSRRWLDGFGSTADAFVRGASERRK